MSAKKLSMVLGSMLGIGLCAHVAVGWMDERRFVLRIVGPLSPLVGSWWVLTLLAAVGALVWQKRVSALPLVTAVVALAGITFIWWYPGH